MMKSAHQKRLVHELEVQIEYKAAMQKR